MVESGLANTPPVIISAAGRAGLPSTEISLATIASRAGYRTAAIGKVGSVRINIIHFRNINKKL